MGGMKKAIGLGEKIGAIKKVEPVVKKEPVKDAIKESTEEDRIRTSKRKGRKYSIKTSAAGLNEELQTQKKTLLGG